MYLICFVMSLLHFQTKDQVLVLAAVLAQEIFLKADYLTRLLPLVINSSKSAWLPRVGAIAYHLML